MSDELLIIEEDEEQPNETESRVEPWLIAIIDDEQDVHTITRQVLKHFKFDERPLEFVSAYSAAEGRKLFEEHDNIAICLLDVVMESDHSGLEMIRFIRNEIHNTFTRIVLRTGQPGQAPEEEIIAQYDINDYKEKTELTRAKLHTLIYSCLRSYRDIVTLENTRKGLEKVIEASTEVFSNRYLPHFAQGILQQMTSILQFDNDAFYGVIEGFAAQSNNENEMITVIAGIGEYENLTGISITELMPEETLHACDCVEQGCFESIHTENQYFACYTGEDGPKTILVIKGLGAHDRLKKRLIDIFTKHVLIAFENIYLKSESEADQREMVYILGEAVESHCTESGQHLKRVADVTRLLAEGMGLDEKFAGLMAQASPLHDLGKVGITDKVLNKQGKLNSEEWEIMKQHVEIGYNILKNSRRKILQTGAAIALDHHERWDGKGYPNGKKGSEISIEGRIVAVADVLDALASKRCYKLAWQMDEVFEYMQLHSGTQFDPEVISVLFEIKEQVSTLYAST